MRAIYAIGLQKESANSGSDLLYDDVVFLCSGYDPHVEGSRDRAITKIVQEVKKRVGANHEDQLKRWIFIDGVMLHPSFEIKLDLVS